MEIYEKFILWNGLYYFSCFNFGEIVSIVKSGNENVLKLNDEENVCIYALTMT